MRRYETITILDPDLSEDDRATLCESITDRISQHNGFLVEVDDWGNRKLAYEIKKKPRGYYVRFDYCGLGTLVDEMERYMRITDGFLKYLTVLLSEDADMDQIKEEIAEREAAAAEKAEAEALSAVTEADEDSVEVDTEPAEAPEAPAEAEPAEEADGSADTAGASSDEATPEQEPEKEAEV